MRHLFDGTKQVRGPRVQLTGVARSEANRLARERRAACAQATLRLWQNLLLEIDTLSEETGYSSEYFLQRMGLLDSTLKGTRNVNGWNIFQKEKFAKANESEQHISHF
jgi:hypothetical protein